MAVVVFSVAAGYVRARETPSFAPSQLEPVSDVGPMHSIGGPHRLPRDRVSARLRSNGRAQIPTIGDMYSKGLGDSY